MISASMTHRPLVWLRRYLPAQLICTAAGLLCAWATPTFTDNAAAAVVACIWVEILFFYGTILICDLAHRGAQTLSAVLYDLVREFGPAEVLDSLLLRPALMYAGAMLAPSLAIGIVVGKLAADLAFYAPVILSYELLCRMRPQIEH
ncbi:MAG TPA: hypothetical protein VFO07_04600 [Roseiflexaceae bacterium]|nr:hypothetical protein [Roseiflexaceae bacterium]